MLTPAIKSYTQIMMLINLIPATRLYTWIVYVKYSCSLLPAVLSLQKEVQLISSNLRMWNQQPNSLLPYIALLIFIKNSRKNHSHQNRIPKPTKCINTPTPHLHGSGHSHHHPIDSCWRSDPHWDRHRDRLTGLLRRLCQEHDQQHESGHCPIPSNGSFG